MPEPLVCEGPDLAALLAQVHSQPGARILYQDTVRRGGVGGFFAKEIHRIAYDVPPPAPAPTEAPDDTARDELVPGMSHSDEPAGVEQAAASAPVIEDADLAFEALLAGADELDCQPVGAPSGSDFASVLAAASSEPATEPAVQQTTIAPPPAIEALAAVVAERRAASPTQTAPTQTAPTQTAPTQTPPTQTPPATEPMNDSAAALMPTRTIFAPAPGEPAAEPEILSAAATELDVEPRGDTATVDAAAEPQPDDATALDPAAESALGRPGARDRLEVLLQLRELGVPVGVNPRAEALNLYEALEDILQELPAPVPVPRRAGDILAIVGETNAALRAARTCLAKLGTPDATIAIAGMPRELAVALGHTPVCDATEARLLHTALAAGTAPSIVIIATDGSDADPAELWERELLNALAPTSVWAVIDARWKVEDGRAHLKRLDAVDALVVHSAELSGSPVAVWDLDVPLALLDGRSASTLTWAGLLFRLLGTDALRQTRN